MRTLTMDSSRVRDYIIEQVPDWDDEIVANARFKAFSGQRSDWEPKYLFWRNLILKIARHFGLFIVQPSQVKEEWFNRGGLTPLCIDHVLLLMYNEGDVVRALDIKEPTSGRISRLFRIVRNLVSRSISSSEILLEDHVVLTSLLKDKAFEVVDVLSESHWTSSCVVTMAKFCGLCGGQSEASAVLNFLSGYGKAQYLSTSKEFIEGVKISLSSAPVSTMSSFDCDVLHLVWTTEKLQQQIDVIDRRYEISRKSASVALNAGNKKVALRHAREMKLASQNREKCTSLLNRVEEVLTTIANAESTKKVSEAIQIGARAMKENKLTVEEVELCLDELEEAIDLQKQVEKSLESTPFVGIEDEDIMEELKKLELEAETADSQLATPKIRMKPDTSDALSDALSNLKLQDVSGKEYSDEFCVSEEPVTVSTNDAKSVALEPA